MAFTCDRARQVWKSLGLDEIIDATIRTDRSGSVVMEELLRNPVKKSPVLGQLGLQETIAVDAWYIWWEHREAVKGVNVKPAPSSSFSIQAITSNHVTRPAAVTSEAQWQCPAPGSYKLNVDASFFEDGSGAAADVLRNCHGEAIVGVSELIDNTLSAQSAEAIALRLGLRLVYAVGCRNIEVESDCEELVHACNGETEIWSPYSGTLADCFHLSHGIPNISFAHCPREANKVAHFLARRCYDSKICEEWLDEMPSFLLPHVIFDVTLSQIE